MEITKKQFRQLCVKHSPKFKINNPIDFDIPIQSEKEAVFIEYRCMSHLDVIIRNAVCKLGPDWAHTVVCNQQNELFMKNMCASIHPNIRVVCTDQLNMTHAMYNTMLSSAYFWNLLQGEKILIYQEDSFIFKHNINDFMQWDYVGAPFAQQSAVGPHNVGNGGLSLRTKSVMLQVIQQCPIETETTNSAFVTAYMKHATLKILPEDIYFSQVIQRERLGKVADVKSAALFSSETVYNAHSFGMHCMWYSCKSWKLVMETHLIRPGPGPGKGARGANGLTKKKVMEEKVGEIVAEEQKMTEKIVEKKSNNTKVVNKLTFRNACLEQLPLFQTFQIPHIELNNSLETILIEFRWFPHIEFLIRNIILKLPHWSHTVVCGNLNMTQMTQCCNSISPNIRIISLDLNNLTPSDYSSLLTTVDFWQLFNGTKLLIYQEDSFLFHADSFNDYLTYDYIGAPWIFTQNDNILGVGNGGFSLRTKQIMIDVIQYNKCNPTHLIINHSTIDYMTNTKSYVVPEDVYFTKTMIDFKIGQVAPRTIANSFSQECVESNDPNGGHNYFLASTNKIHHVGLIKITNKIAIYCPYPFTLGGGEQYITNIISHFILLNYEVTLFNNTDFQTIQSTLLFYNVTISQIQVCPIFNLRDIHTQCVNSILFDYFIEMSNGIIPMLSSAIQTPIVNKIAHRHIFHCQFPENYYESTLTVANKSAYIDTVIVNSEFTFDYVQPHFNNKVKILYPLVVCNPIINSTKNPIKFVTIGRLFPYVKNSNCKHIDKIINVFTQINEPCELHIICSVKNMKYYHSLLSTIPNELASGKIVFYPDCSDETKYNIISSSAYYIHATGIISPKHKSPSEEEHFGISIIEALCAECIPICADRGYPPFYIKNNLNGYLFDTLDELKTIIQQCVSSNVLIDNNNAIVNNKMIANKYTNKQKYVETLNKILVRI